MIQAAKFIGAGLATIGLAGAGVGIGTVFGAVQLKKAMRIPIKFLSKSIYKANILYVFLSFF